jgi:hypothetical protein
LYYYSKKKAREPVAHVHAITSGHVIDAISGHVISGHVASGDITSGSTTWHHLTCDFGCAEILLMGFELATLVVIGTACTGSCKSNYHTTITTMTAQLRYGTNHSFAY